MVHFSVVRFMVDIVVIYYLLILIQHGFWKFCSTYEIWLLIVKKNKASIDLFSHLWSKH